MFRVSYEGTSGSGFSAVSDTGLSMKQLQEGGSSCHVFFFNSLFLWDFSRLLVAPERESAHIPDGSCMVFDNSPSEITSMLSAHILFFGSVSPSPHNPG